MGVFIAVNILVLIIVGVRIYYFVQHNPKDVLKDKFVSKLIFQIFFFIVDEWSTIMFWLSFFINGYWFLMYKLSDGA